MNIQSIERTLNYWVRSYHQLKHIAPIAAADCRKEIERYVDSLSIANPITVTENTLAMLRFENNQCTILVAWFVCSPLRQLTVNAIVIKT